MLSETDLIILRGAAKILGTARDTLTDAGIESDEPSVKRNAFYTAGVFYMAREAVATAVIAYEVRFPESIEAPEPQSLRVPDDASMNAVPHPLSYVEPVTRMGYAVERLDAMRDCLHRGDYLAALRTADSFAALFSELLADVAQHAYDDGASKAAIARALGVNVSTFRGMVRS